MKKLKNILSYLRGSCGLFALSLLFAFLSTGSRLFIPIIAGKAVDKLVLDSHSDITGYILVIFCLIAIGTVFRYAFDYLTSVVGQRTIKNIRKRLYESYLKAPVSLIDQSKKGDLLATVINDVENVQTGLVSGFAALYDGIVAIIITIVFMFSIHWLLALIVVCLTPVSILASKFISKSNSKYFRSQAACLGALNAFTLESLNNSEAVTTLDIRESREELFDSLNRDMQKSLFKANFAASTINPLTRLVNALINGAVIMLGILILIQQWDLGTVFMVGDLSAFLTYSANYMQPFTEVTNVITEINFALASFRRIDTAIHSEKDPDDGTKVIPGTIETLCAKNIDFSYDGKRPIIRDFSLDFPKGKKVAFVGTTGCGKTTVINLLMRFYDPQSGSFYADGISTKDLEKAAFRSHVGMVLQDTWIFSGTVFENIAYAKPGATMEEVVEAAKKAEAHSFIERLPDGYHTKVTDSSGLSVGEKQLLCVARVMLMQPEIVILDEATSSVDLRTENLLAKAFDKLMEGKTSLVVAHRLSTIVSSDLICVMDAGKIMETGTHQELLAKKGMYYRLYNAQFS